MISRGWLWSTEASPITVTPISDQDRISPYNIKQTSDKSLEKYPLGYQLIQNQILQTNDISMRIVQPTELRKTQFSDLRRLASKSTHAFLKIKDVSTICT